MHARLISTPLVIAALAVPAAAIAKTPKFSFKKPSIVPGQSIGGVSVGMTKHQAAAVWGAPDRCVKFENVIWCQYLTVAPLQGGGSTTTRVQRARVQVGTAVSARFAAVTAK